MCIRDRYFYNKVTVAAMLILYGVVFIVLERRNRRRLREAEAALEAPRGRHARVSYGDAADEAEASLFKITDVDEIDWKTALKIGCFQVLATVSSTHLDVYTRQGQHLVGQLRPVCRHRVARLPGSQDDGVGVRTLVAHDADALHVGPHGEVLPYAAFAVALAGLLVHADVVGVQLLAHDSIGVFQNLQLLARHRADDAAGQTRSSV